MDKVYLVPNKVTTTGSLNTKIAKGIEMVGSLNFWRENIFGENVVIAVIDTGCQCDHPSLKDNIIGGRNFTSDYEGNSLIYDDNISHGTHVAGIIAASFSGEVDVGVAPKSKLLILKAISVKGHGSYASLIDAINYAIEWKGDSGERVRIITMSLGGPKDDKRLHEAVKLAVKNNILVVCASGNSGDNDLTTEEIMYPGYYQEVVEVGAVDLNHNLAPFSNTNNQVDIYAPGVNILSTSTRNQYIERSGTSMAAPHIAGAAALIISKFESRGSRIMSEKELYAELASSTKRYKNLNILYLK